jgi:methionyl-tRNA synthetase
MAVMKTLYLTTPLYYVNAAPHIGHSYTEVAADALARYHRLQGHEVFLLTGTDEHGQKIAQAAAAAGKPPQAFVDEVVERFKALWERLGIAYDDFIRTTEPRHTKAVQQILTRLQEAGKLTRAEYQGWYCTPDETFWTQEEVGASSRADTPSPPRPAVGAPGSVAGAPACPTCGRPLESTREEGWYLRLRAHQDWLKRFVDGHADFVRPQTRYNELKGLLEQPLPEYLCITRPKSRVAWGIPVPFSPDHVVYVWFDALLNYITVPGYLSDERRFAGLWPADVHFIGKDILRHHALYWPIMLHELGFADDQMPKIFAHGWWRIGEQKMSKSLGNIVDPSAIVGGLLKDQPFAADVYRYFLLREVSFGQDGAFSEDAVLTRLQTDLANDLGNLVNRTLAMIGRYCEGRIPAAGPVGCAVDDEPLRQEALALVPAMEAAMAAPDFSAALAAIMALVAHANRYIESQAPWKLAKDKNQARLGTVLSVVAEVLRSVAITLQPFMPSVSTAIWQQLGLSGRPSRLTDAAVWPGLTPGQPIDAEHPVLFPRAEGSAVRP